MTLKKLPFNIFFKYLRYFLCIGGGSPKHTTYLLLISTYFIRTSNNSHSHVFFGHEKLFLLLILRALESGRVQEINIDPMNMKINLL